MCAILYSAYELKWRQDKGGASEATKFSENFAIKHCDCLQFVAGNDIISSSSFPTMDMCLISDARSVIYFRMSSYLLIGAISRIVELAVTSF